MIWLKLNIDPETNLSDPDVANLVNHTRIWVFLLNSDYPYIPSNLWIPQDDDIYFGDSSSQREGELL
ncbi:hypothetical protein RJG79_08885 [Mycoplasmatota bacterium WC44]